MVDPRSIRTYIYMYEHVNDISNPKLYVFCVVIGYYFTEEIKSLNCALTSIFWEMNSCEFHRWVGGRPLSTIAVSGTATD